MILIVHNQINVIEVCKIEDNQKIVFNSNQSIVSVVKNISFNNPKELIIWVFEPLKKEINFDVIHEVFHHKRVMASYSVKNEFIISERIGYVEKSPYTNIKANVNYPTWLMSSDIGGFFAKSFNDISSTISDCNNNFDFFLTSLAKHNMPKGLFCYSNPRLLRSDKTVEFQINKKSSVALLFKFVKQNYKPIWIFNLFICFVFFEKRFPIISLLKAMFIKKNEKKVNLNPLEFKSSLKVIEKGTIDVIIPTIGRKDSLYSVLKDISKQSILPKHVIIIEQNSLSDSKTELHDLIKESWPFNIKHRFIHQTGACNARNMALSLVESEWVLLADDDNEFDADLIEELFKSIKQLGITVATTMYIQPNEEESYLMINQTDIFGSGNSMIRSSLLKKVSFDMAYEFGYGEDSDFGMQLRKSGNDVIYFPDIKITHLKLPYGGFRTKHTPEWEKEKIQPKPSPTIMLFNKKHYNEFQIKGSKYVMFAKYYKNQNIKNPFKYIRYMNARWRSSEKWAKILQLQSET